MSDENLTLAEWQSMSGEWVDFRFTDDDLLQRGLVAGEEGAEVLAAAMQYVIAVGRAQRCVLKAEQDIRGGTAHWLAELQGEAADAFLTLLSLAHRAGFSLADAAEAKWFALVDRQYVKGPPVGLGNEQQETQR